MRNEFDEFDQYVVNLLDNIDNLDQSGHYDDGGDDDEPAGDLDKYRRFIYDSDGTKHYL